MSPRLPPYETYQTSSMVGVGWRDYPHAMSQHYFERRSRSYLLRSLCGLLVAFEYTLPTHNLPECKLCQIIRERQSNP